MDQGGVRTTDGPVAGAVTDVDRVPVVVHPHVLDDRVRCRKLKPPVWWKVPHGVELPQVPAMEPPSQQSAPEPSIDTGQSSTWVHDAERASTARWPEYVGLYRLGCAPETTDGLWARHWLGSGTGIGSGTGVGSGTGTGVGSGVGTGCGSGCGVGPGAGSSAPSAGPPARGRVVELVVLVSSGRVVVMVVVVW